MAAHAGFNDALHDRRRKQLGLLTAASIRSSDHTACTPATLNCGGSIGRETAGHTRPGSLASSACSGGCGASPVSSAIFSPGRNGGALYFQRRGQTHPVGSPALTRMSSIARPGSGHRRPVPYKSREFAGDSPDHLSGSCIRLSSAFRSSRHARQLGAQLFVHWRLCARSSSVSAVAALRMASVLSSAFTRN